MIACWTQIPQLMWREVPKGAHKFNGKWQQHWFTANWWGVSLIRILAQTALWYTPYFVWGGRLSHIGAVSHYALGRNFRIICDLSTVSLIRTWARQTRTWSTELIAVNQLQNVTCFISLQYFWLSLNSSFSFCLFLFWFRWFFCFFFFSVCLFPSHLRRICFYFTYCLEVRPVFTWFTVKKRNIQQLLQGL